jgi:hypothetical protein
MLALFSLFVFFLFIIVYSYALIIFFFRFLFYICILMVFVFAFCELFVCEIVLLLFGFVWVICSFFSFFFYYSFFLASDLYQEPNTSRMQYILFFLPKFGYGFSWFSSFDCPIRYSLTFIYCFFYFIFILQHIVLLNLARQNWWRG